MDLSNAMYVVVDKEVFQELVEKGEYLNKAFDSLTVSTKYLADLRGLTVASIHNTYPWDMPGFGQFTAEQIANGATKRSWKLREVYNWLKIPEAERKAEYQRLKRERLL